MAELRADFIGDPELMARTRTPPAAVACLPKPRDSPFPPPSRGEGPCGRATIRGTPPHRASPPAESRADV
eukprot:2056370-Prymnesium_polylepis.1